MARAVSVQAVFSVERESDEEAYAVAAEIIDLLNDAANGPPGGCDVRISVERASALPAEAP